MESSEYDTKHIKVLDGIRALAIMIIVWYHFWQQSWLTPSLKIINIDFIPRYGFLFVDLMIFLSAFCLFLPYARAKVYGEKVPKTKDFYTKRIARIMPSYYLSMVIAFIFVVILKSNWFNGFFIKDTLMNMFFIQNWSRETIVATNYIGALWTVAIEVQFYLIFPFLAKRFIKNPVITYFIMMLLGVVCTVFICNQNIYNDLSFYVNHLLTFIPVYANGMLAAYIYLSFTKNRKRNIIISLLCTVISILTIYAYAILCKTIGTNNVQIWQLNHRVTLAFLFMLFVLSTLLASRIYQKIFNNRFMKFIATISFNLYIYHQFIAVKLKAFRIPYYEGDIPPNMLGDKVWQWKYTILCITVSLTVAILMTYLVEKPIANLIKKKLKCKS